jgi:hypothetical protein
MGKKKQHVAVHAKDLEQKDSSSVTSSSSRVGIMISRGEEVVRHSHLSHGNDVQNR